MEPSLIKPDSTMAEVMDTWPETIPVFLAKGMSCVGCYLSSFDTLAEALKIHGLPVAEVLETLNQCILESRDSATNNHRDEQRPNSAGPEAGQRPGDQP